MIAGFDHSDLGISLHAIGYLVKLMWAAQTRGNSARGATSSLGGAKKIKAKRHQNLHEI